MAGVYKTVQEASLDLWSSGAGCMRSMVRLLKWLSWLGEETSGVETGRAVFYACADGHRGPSGVNRRCLPRGLLGVARVELCGPAQGISTGFAVTASGHTVSRPGASPPGSLPGGLTQKVGA